MTSRTPSSVVVAFGLNTRSARTRDPRLGRGAREASRRPPRRRAVAPAPARVAGASVTAGAASGSASGSATERGPVGSVAGWVVVGAVVPAAGARRRAGGRGRAPARSEVAVARVPGAVGGSGQVSLGARTRGTRTRSPGHQAAARRPGEPGRSRPRPSGRRRARTPPDRGRRAPRRSRSPKISAGIEPPVTCRTPRTLVERDVSLDMTDPHGGREDRCGAGEPRVHVVGGGAGLASDLPPRHARRQPRPGLDHPLQHPGGHVGDVRAERLPGCAVRQPDDLATTVLDAVDDGGGHVRATVGQGRVRGGHVPGRHPELSTAEGDLRLVPGTGESTPMARAVPATRSMPMSMPSRAYAPLTDRRVAPASVTSRGSERS